MRRVFAVCGIRLDGTINWIAHLVALSSDNALDRAACIDAHFGYEVSEHECDESDLICGRVLERENEQGSHFWEWISALSLPEEVATEIETHMEQTSENGLSTCCPAYRAKDGRRYRWH